MSLSKDFRVLKGVAYKSGQVPSMLIDIAGKKRWNDCKSALDLSNQDANQSRATVSNEAMNTTEEQEVLPKVLACSRCHKMFLDAIKEISNYKRIS